MGSFLLLCLLAAVAAALDEGNPERIHRLIHRWHAAGCPDCRDVADERDDLACLSADLLNRVTPEVDTPGPFDTTSLVEVAQLETLYQLPAADKEEDR